MTAITAAIALYRYHIEQTSVITTFQSTLRFLHSQGQKYILNRSCGFNTFCLPHTADCKYSKKLHILYFFYTSFEQIRHVKNTTTS